MPPRRRNQTNDPTLEAKIPESFKACKEGWIQRERSNEHTFKLMTEDEFDNQFLADSLLHSYLQYAGKIPEEASLIGEDYNKTTDAFKVLLSDTALIKIVRFTNGFLRRSSLLATNISEYRQFLAHKFLLGRYKGSIEIAFREELPMLGVKHGFHCMDLKRFRDLLVSTHGFPIDDRGGGHEADTWHQKKNILRNINELERDIFAPSVKLMLNKKSGIIVVDDELISSRANDVETKTLSHRKSGKDGPVCDCISDSSTGVLLGMRLRVRGETQQNNVEKLLETLPIISSHQEKIRLCFDRGYGKMSFIERTCERNYNVSTIAATLGSRHSYITSDEVQKLRDEWNKKKVPEAAQTLAYNTFKDYVIESGELLGPDMRMATREVKLSNGKTKRVVATAMRDKFDRHQACKDLRFFSSGAEADEMFDIWIATSQSISVPNNTLFKKRMSPLAIETRLLQSCQPITLDQRTADWFCQRSFKVTGTTVGQLLQMHDPSDAPHLVFKKCLDSWFGRHRSSEAMQIGTLNEVPVTEKLAELPFVKEFFNIGLVEWKIAPFVGVSADGVVEFSLPHEGGQEQTEFACVEIKTRSSPTTIQSAENVATKHGHIVYCTYGDEIFNECVATLDNRYQLLHQAVVTGLDYGIFVVSKVEDGEGSIIQVVVVSVTAVHKQSIGQAIRDICGDIVAWCYKPGVMERGYLIDSDYPEWLPCASYEAQVARTQYRLWVAQYKRIRNDGVTYVPTYPVASYKHAMQYLYNKGKWGLDKNTEACQTFSIDARNLSFETKYVFRMIDGVMYNHWRFAQAFDIIKPFVVSLGVRRPSQGEIRRKARNLTLLQHIFDSSIKFLIRHEVEKKIGTRAAAASIEWGVGHGRTTRSGRALVSENENVVMREIKKMRDAKRFPVRNKRARLFDREPALKRLRLLETRNFKHYPEAQGEGSYAKSCALCNEARTSHWCPVCCVPLCKGEHFKIWHSEIDLLQAHESAKAEAKAGKLLRKQGEASQLQVPNEEESESGSSGSPFVLESSDSADATSTLTMDGDDSFLRNADEMDNY